MVPACACGRQTELELFSITSGRMLRKLAPVSTKGFEGGSTPAAADDGRLFFTFVSGPRCAASGVYMECPQFAPNSCRNDILTFSPGQSRLHPLFAVPGSDAVVGAVVPNPDDRQVALTLTPCVAIRGTTGLFVRDLGTGVTRAIVTSSNRCDGFGPTAWSRTGRELMFPIERANGRPITMAGGIGCPSGRNYLALASATQRGRLRLIDPDRGCVFRAAAFDRAGIVAAEGCNRGDPEHGVGAYLGYAYVLQYSARGHLTRRIPLHLGLEQAVLETEPSTGDALMTEDQPANEPYPERDWVYELDGHQLRPIAHYRAEDAPQVLAVPW
jgi:hypothetical protein